MNYVVVACFILNAGFLFTLGTYTAIKFILWFENKYHSEKKNGTNAAQDSPITNREKAIADIVEQLPKLTNKELALVLFWCFYDNIGCPHCGFYEDGKVCDKRSADCMRRLEDWVNGYDYA